MANAVKIDNTAEGEAFLQASLSGLDDGTVPIFTEFEVYLPAATLTQWNSVSPDFGPDLWESTGGAANGVSPYRIGEDGGDYDSYIDFFVYPAVTPQPVTAGWHTIRCGNVANAATGHIVVDGVDATYTKGGSALGSASAMRWGILYGPSGGIVYLGRIRVGSTLGGSDILEYTPATDGPWAEFLNAIDDAAFTASAGPATDEDAPVPPPSAEEGGGAAPAGRVLIAFDDPALEPDPTWTRIDTIDNLVAGFDIRRGRQTEFDVTETSSATVLINDTAGRFDPNNASSPYFGNLDGKQILLQLWNPVAAEWSSLWRGHIDDYGHDFNPATNPDGTLVVANVQIRCVDLFDYLANVEMIPGVFGDTPPSGSEGIVFYEDTDFQTRLTQLATDARLPADRFRFFTGNVDVQEVKYDPGDSVLVAMRDTVDAELPGIANLFCDRFGRVVAHGRFARFDPEGTAAGSDWIFTRWKAGDGAAIALDPDRAQIRPPLSWTRPRSRIYNAAIAYPRFPVRGSGGGTFTETDMAGQIVIDTTSRDAYGYRSYPAMSDLLTLRNFNNSNDAKTETKLFADYYVENYKDPRTRVEALTFKSVDPDDARGPATWALLAGFDISDIVDLKHGYPGGEGINESLYIEGSEMTVRPLNPGYDMVELTLNVSPQDTVDVFA